ncbi:MAG: AtpZ/AtpI family protein [Pirellulales bacterium]
MEQPSEDRPPMAVAMEWVSKLTTVSLMMILPGILGNWLDKRWGTGFLALVGFALGLVAGVWQLLVFVRADNKSKQ